MSPRSAAASASLVAGGTIALVLLVAAFSPVGVHALGWDAPGYVVQVRAARDGVLDLPGSRPGVAVAGAVLDGAGLIPAGLAPAVLSLLAAVCVGLGAAVAFRRWWPNAGWALGAAVLLVSTWGGTTRLASGYLANLIALALFVGAIALALGPTVRWPAVAAAFAASLLVHPGAAPAWAAILVGWIVAEGIARRDRDADRAVATLVAFLAAAVVVTAVVAWGVGLSLDDVQDLVLVRERFDERAAEIVAWIRPALAGTLLVAGLSVALRLAPEPRFRAAARLGIVWLAICAAGLPLLALVPSVPGHRLVLLAVPLPLLGTWAISGGAGWLSQRFGGAAARIAPIAAAAVAVVLAILALTPFDARASRSSPSIGPAPSEVAGYLRAADVHVPVVLVMDPADRRGLLAWKARLNAVRALAPEDVMLRIVAYVGDERTLTAGRPTDGDELVDAITDRTWPSVRAVLDEEHVVVVVRSWVWPETWARVQDRAVGEELAIVEGPSLPTAPRPVPVPSIPPLEAFVVVAGTIVILAALGFGWARVTAAGDVADALGLAPLAGLAIVVLGGAAVALVGGDPGGTAGRGVIAVASLAGWLGSWVVRGTRRYARSASASRTRSTSATVW